MSSICSDLAGILVNNNKFMVTFANIFFFNVSLVNSLLGIWADDSDNDEQQTSSRSTRKPKPKDYTAPIGFVAGGVQQAGKKKDQEGESDKSEDEDGKWLDM